MTVRLLGTAATALAIGGGLSLIGCAAAADAQGRRVAVADAAGLDRALASARGGETLVLAPKEFGLVTIARLRFTRPVVIVAGEARLRLALRQSSGIELRGGQVTGAVGPGPMGYGINIVGSDHVTISGTSFTASNRGIVMGKSTDIAIHDVSMTAMIVDGIDIGSSQRVVIRKVTCRDFNSGPAHPDCVQMWSRPEGVTSDVTITDSLSTGAGMQGFTGFNHVRNGVDDGGFDRITVTGNTVVGNFPHGVALYDCRHCVVTGNRTSRAPGSRYRVSVNIFRCLDCVVSDNRVGP